MHARAHTHTTTTPACKQRKGGKGTARHEWKRARAGGKGSELHEKEAGNGEGARAGKEGAGATREAR